MENNPSPLKKVTSTDLLDDSSPVTPNLDPEWDFRKSKREKKKKFIEKKYISANELLIKSFELAKIIKDDGFEPTFIIALWRGGSLVGCAVQEAFSYWGIHTNHIAIRTRHYFGIEKRSKKGDVQIFGLNYVVDTANTEDNLLIIDDVFDSGKSVHALKMKLKEKMRKNLPHKIKVGVIYSKPTKKLDFIDPPDYFVEETTKWLVFPHELEGLKRSEIEEKNSGILKIIGERKKTKKKDRKKWDAENLGVETIRIKDKKKKKRRKKRWKKKRKKK